MKGQEKYIMRINTEFDIYLKYFKEVMKVFKVDCSVLAQNNVDKTLSNPLREVLRISLNFIEMQ